MHIAVCMDVAADRKQLERLLGRSTDKRLIVDDTVPFYIQSYGNKQALLNRPGMYDLFFINIKNDTIDSISLIRELRGLGVTASIVFCPTPDEIEAHVSDNFSTEDDVLILEQPIVAAKLEEVMDVAVARVKDKMPSIVIRSNNLTLHYQPEDILYIEMVKDGSLVHLKDGGLQHTSESVKNIWERIKNFEKIYYFPDYIIANVDFIEKTGFASVTLKDSRKFRASRKWIQYMKTVESNK